MRIVPKHKFIIKEYQDHTNNYWHVFALYGGVNYEITIRKYKTSYSMMCKDMDGSNKNHYISIANSCHNFDDWFENIKI